MMKSAEIEEGNRIIARMNEDGLDTADILTQLSEIDLLETPEFVSGDTAAILRRFDLAEVSEHQIHNPTEAACSDQTGAKVLRIDKISERGLAAIAAYSIDKNIARSDPLESY